MLHFSTTSVHMFHCQLQRAVKSTDLCACVNRPFEGPSIFLPAQGLCWTNLLSPPWQGSGFCCIQSSCSANHLFWMSSSHGPFWSMSLGWTSFHCLVIMYQGFLHHCPGFIASTGCLSRLPSTLPDFPPPRGSNVNFKPRSYGQKGFQHSLNVSILQFGMLLINLFTSLACSCIRYILMTFQPLFTPSHLHYHNISTLLCQKHLHP